MALTKIQTTTGTALPEELGRTLVHEHLLVGFPGWELDARAPKFKRAEAMARAKDQLQELIGLGVSTFVDPCPMDMGRDVEFLAEASQASGMRIICTTGAYCVPSDGAMGVTCCGFAGSGAFGFGVGLPVAFGGFSGWNVCIFGLGGAPGGNV